MRLTHVFPHFTLHTSFSCIFYTPYTNSTKRFNVHQDDSLHSTRSTLPFPSHLLTKLSKINLHVKRKPYLFHTPKEKMSNGAFPPSHVAPARIDWSERLWGASENHARVYVHAGGPDNSQSAVIGLRAYPSAPRWQQVRQGRPASAIARILRKTRETSARPFYLATRGREMFLLECVIQMNGFCDAAGICLSVFEGLDSRFRAIKFPIFAVG